MVGYQSAGEVIEVGSAVKDIQVGDKVVVIGMTGSHAEKRKVLAATAW